MKIERMNKGSWGKIKAFFDLQTEDGFTIKGFKLVEGTNGLFVGFPSQKGGDDEYHDTVWVEKEVREQVIELAKREYESSTEQEQELPVMPTEDLPF
jgi:stage V sporulation protein G